MPIITQNLILSSTLFLAPSHPALIKQHSSQVWFSDPNAIEAHALEHGLLLKAQKSRARLQASGLTNKTSKQSWTTLQVVSDKNYKALERCPSITFEWNSKNQLPIFSSNSSRTLIESLSTISECQFDELEFNETDSKFPDFQKILSQMESEAEWKGFRILSKSWLDGRKQIILSEGNSVNRFKSLLGPLAPFVEIQTKSAPKPGNTLIFEVTLFEFSRNAADKLGLTWPTHIKFLPLEGNLFKQAQSSLELGLDFGESHGVGRILAKPQIRVKAGQIAKFHSGGEIPIQIITEEVKKTEWKTYGLMLEIGVPKETATGASEVTVDFKVELSEPNISMGSEVSPGLSVRRLESQFDLRVRESTVLSTMIQTQSGAHRAGVQGLSKIPVLQNIFSSKSQQNHESELWFAIRPLWDEISWQDNLEEKGLNDISNL